MLTKIINYTFFWVVLNLCTQVHKKTIRHFFILFFRVLSIRWTFYFQMPCVLFEFANIRFFFYVIKNSGYMGDCAIIWKWWPVFILAVSYNTLKITQDPKRERDWRQLGNQLLILAHSIPLWNCPSRHFPLTHLSKGCSFFYLSIQYLLDVLQNSYPGVHNIMPLKCDLKLMK